MATNEFHLLVALTAILMGLGVFWLSLAASDLIGTAVRRLWLAASPAAARQARFRAALAAYRGRSRKRVRRTG